MSIWGGYAMLLCGLVGGVGWGLCLGFEIQRRRLRRSQEEMDQLWEEERMFDRWEEELDR